MSITNHTHLPEGVHSMSPPPVANHIPGFTTTMVMEACPCDLDMNCEQDCCIEALREAHRACPPPVANHIPGFATPLGTMVMDACPCDMDMNCEQDCCIEAMRETHRARVAKVTSNSPKLLRHEDRLSVSSYGSMDSLNEKFPASPMGSINPKDEVDEDRQPLLNSQRDLVVQSPSGGPILTVRGSSPPDQSIRCDCHVKVVDHTTRKAVIKLIVASVIALVFMVGEVIGGHYANSLAIMTDAAHMLSDFIGFLISLFAIWVSQRPPSRGMSFGWHRAEVIGALVSVLIIWVLTGVLFYEAVSRVVHRNFEVNSNIMLITACVGVFVNVFMCMVLGHGHGHSHGGSGHTHGDHDQARKFQTPEERREARMRKRSAENINVRAAFIHVIGDLIQSIGVVIAGYIIWIWPHLKLADPICTFLFCILVLFSTFNILKDALRVVMEGTPKHIDYEEVKSNLGMVLGVKQAHSLHIWSLTLNRTALSAHLVLEPGAESDEVLARASSLLKQQHHITQTTLQVEGHQQLMDDCTDCQEAERTGVLQGLIPNFLRKKRQSRI